MQMYNLKLKETYSNKYDMNKNIKIELLTKLIGQTIQELS